MASTIEQLSATERLERRIALFVVFTPLVGVFAAIVLLWGWGVGIVDLLLLITFYAITALGITAGFHRYFTHKSFETYTPVKLFLGISGCMAAQGPIIYWSAIHRRHHQHSDQENDPHSPHTTGESIWEHIQGFWHAHVGWMLNHDSTDWIRIVRDLVRDRWVMWMNRNYFLWLLLSLLLPAALGGLLTWSWFGALTGFIWGGLVRIFLVHHTTWSINSICHLFGSKPFNTGDESRNNFLCALFAFGEGWHNNHHAFPSSVRHGLYWWQIDTTFILIWMLEKVGLAWNLKYPKEETLATRQQQGMTQPKAA